LAVYVWYHTYLHRHNYITTLLPGRYYWRLAGPTRHLGANKGMLQWIFFSLVKTIPRLVEQNVGLVREKSLAVISGSHST
jgi:hypothetical protein